MLDSENPLRRVFCYLLDSAYLRYLLRYSNNFSNYFSYNCSSLSTLLAAYLCRSRYVVAFSKDPKTKYGQ